MKYDLLNILQCPKSHSALNLFVIKESKISPGDLLEVELGLLQSKTNPHKIYPIINGIPRMLPDSVYNYLDLIDKNSDKLPLEIKNNIVEISENPIKTLDRNFKHTQNSFTSEWSELKDTDRAFGGSIEFRREEFFKRLGINNSELQYKKVLDVGCGHGEVEMALLDNDIDLYSIDLSYSVDNLYKRLINLNYAPKARINIIQGNLCDLPFEDNFFDIIYADGVLHHTPNTYYSLGSITKKLKNDGKCFAWVYSFDHKNLLEKLRNYITNIVRKITINLPHRILYNICYMLAPFHILYTRSYNFIWNKKRYLKRTLRETSLSLFDGFSPLYDWHHSTQELKQMFNDLGYVEIKKTTWDNCGIGVFGKIKKKKKYQTVRTK